MSFVAMFVGTVGAFRMLPTPDVTWLLHVSGRLLDGARLGRDVVENTPPVILWVKLPLVALGRAIGWDAWYLWIGWTAVLAGASVLGTFWFLRRVPSLRAHAPLLAAVLTIGLFLLPRVEFGQREHVAMALVVPWLLVVGARMESVRLPVTAVVVAGLAGGLGLSIKPHFGLVWVGVAALAIVARGWRGLLLREVLVPAGVGAACIALTLLMHPDWLDYALRFGPLYQRFERSSPVMVGLAGEGVEWSWLGFLALAVFGGSRPTRRDALSILVVAQAGFHLAAAFQMKGWGYQFVPAGTVGLMVAVAAGAAAGWPRTRLVDRVYRVAVVLGVVAVALVGSLRSLALVASERARWSDADPSLPALLAEVRKSGTRESLLVLSTNIAAGWPLAYLTDSGWTSRHPSMWVLGAEYAGALKRPGVVSGGVAPADPEALALFLLDMAADVEARIPTMIIVPVAVPGAPEWAVSQRLDYVSLLMGSLPAMIDECLAGPAARREGYLVWRCERLRTG